MSNENLISGNDSVKPMEDGAASDAVPAVTGKDILTGMEDVVFNSNPLPSDADSAQAAVRVEEQQGAEALTVADLLLIDAGANIEENLGAFLKFDTTSSPGNTIISVDMDGAGGGGAVPVVTLQGVATDLTSLLSNGPIDSPNNIV